ncbi:hypothetical protein TSOC_006986, partial [Tetrabaena socialis]
AGYVRTLYLANPEETRQLIHHPLVDCVHMTGGTVTHDAIVWGSTPEEQERRRKANDPLLKVPITSELGCVSPFIVAGWQFTPKELTVQANNLVVAMTSNNGCNCNSAKVLVLPADWPQSAAFLETVRSVLRGTPHDPPYYPGIHESACADARVAHPPPPTHIPHGSLQAVDSLRYGVVAVNAWSAASCILGACTWGAFSGGQTAADVGSGVGVVGNPFLVEGVQKAVYRTPVDGAGVPKPFHVQPIPLAAARLVLGFVVDGWRGLLRGVWAR